MKLTSAILPAVILAFGLAASAAAQEAVFQGDVRTVADDTARPLMESMRDNAKRFFSANEDREVWVGYDVTARLRLRSSFSRGGGSTHFSHGISMVNGIVISYPEKGILPAGSERKAILYLFADTNGATKLSRVVVLDMSERYYFELPLLLMEGVSDERSISALRLVLDGKEGIKARESALPAVAVHVGDEPRVILEGIVRGNDSADFRKDALFWLGYTVEKDDLGMLVALEKELKNPEVRKQLTFVYYLMKDDRATDRMIYMARNDSSRDVRKQAIFWMGQLANAKAKAELERAIEDDPDIEIKKQAVFALSQMEGRGSIESLMRIARTNKSPAVRKQAIFWISQSGDERAVDFLVELLKK